MNVLPRGCLNISPSRTIVTRSVHTHTCTFINAHAIEDTVECKRMVKEAYSRDSVKISSSPSSATTPRRKFSTPHCNSPEVTATLLHYLEKCQFSNVTVFRFTSRVGCGAKRFPRGGNRVLARHFVSSRGWTNWIVSVGTVAQGTVGLASLKMKDHAHLWYSKR